MHGLDTIKKMNDGTTHGTTMYCCVVLIRGYDTPVRLLLSFDSHKAIEMACSFFKVGELFEDYELFICEI